MYSKNSFSVAKIFVLRPFKMKSAEYFRVEQRSFINFLVTEKSKPWEISKECETYTEKNVLIKTC